MSKDEAIQSMREGNKVTHFLFTDDEFISLATPNDFAYTDEKGYRLPIGEFWQYRKSDVFQTGWELFTKVK